MLLRNLSFVHPGRFWVLAGVALIAVALVLSAVRRRQAGTRYADAALLAAVAPRRPGWRRLPGQVAVVLAMVVLVGSWAQPETLAATSQAKSVVVVAIDASTSMKATDVSPDRFTAAKASAASFIDGLPAQVDVALVSFNRTARLVVAPTSVHRTASDALAGITLDGGTSQGDAILVSLDAVQRALPPVAEGQAPAARIVLLSDGGNSTGSPPRLAVQRAKELGVPVSTIAFGTPQGFILERGGRTPAPIDPAALSVLAQGTGGMAYQAGDAGSLDAVYADIGSQVESDVRREPLAWAGIGIGMALLLAGAVPSVLLLGRVP